MAEDETIRCAWRGSTVTELRCQATKCDPGLLANCREAKCSRLRPSQLREPRPHPEPDSCGGGQNTLRAEPVAEPAPTRDGPLEILLEQDPATVHAVRELARVEGQEPAELAAALLREYLEQLNGGPLEVS